jgi:hypothetical protein
MILQSTSGFVVWHGGIELSTPFATFGEATEWVRSMSGAERVGCFRLTDTLTEVILQGVSDA